MAITRDAAVEAAIVGVSAGALGTSAAIFLNVGIAVADVLSFVGAIFGAAATVGGAAWLSDRSSAREKRAEQVLVRDELATLVDASEGAIKAYREGEWTDQWRSRLSGLIDIGRGAERFLMK